MTADLILASGSPRRREILQGLGVAFEVVPAIVDELDHDEGDPRTLVLENGRMKGAWVSKRYPEAFVLSADTTVALNGRILNKPVDLDDARRMLATLAGNTHQVYTAIHLIHRNWQIHLTHIERSAVTFHDLSAADIDEYIGLVHVLDKAGAYAIQEHRERIVASYEGSFENIMGLPTEVLLRWFAATDIS